MTKRTANSMFVLLGLTGGLVLGLPGAAESQPILERLEQRIRSRIEARQPDQPEHDAATPPADPSAVTPRQDAAPADPSRIEPGYLGLVADDQGEKGRGVRVLAVRPDGPAAQAEFQKEDLITHVAGVRVRSLTDMADILDLFPPGKVAVFQVVRGQEQQRLSVTLGTRPGPPEAPAEPSGPPGGGPPADRRSPPSAVAGVPWRDRAEAPFYLLRRIEALERRVAELEKALAERQTPQ